MDLDSRISNRKQALVLVPLSSDRVVVPQRFHFVVNYAPIAIEQGGHLSKTVLVDIPIHFSD